MYVFKHDERPNFDERQFVGDGSMAVMPRLNPLPTTSDSVSPVLDPLINYWDIWIILNDRGSRFALLPRELNHLIAVCYFSFRVDYYGGLIQSVTQRYGVDNLSAYELNNILIVDTPRGANVIFERHYRQNCESYLSQFVGWNLYANMELTFNGVVNEMRRLDSDNHSSLTRPSANKYIIYSRGRSRRGRGIDSPVGILRYVVCKYLDAGVVKNQRLDFADNEHMIGMMFNYLIMVVVPRSDKPPITMLVKIMRLEGGLLKLVAQFNIPIWYNYAINDHNICFICNDPLNRERMAVYRIVPAFGW